MKLATQQIHFYFQKVRERERCREGVRMCTHVRVCFNYENYTDLYRFYTFNKRQRAAVTSAAPQQTFELPYEPIGSNLETSAENFSVNKSIIVYLL